MKLTDIKKALINVIDANSLLNQTNRVKLSAQDQLGPTLERIASTHDSKLTSKISKSLVDALCRQNRKLDKNKLFNQLVTACKVVGREAELLEKSLDKDNLEYIMRETLDVKQAQIIQFITIADFFLESARTLAVVIQELEVYNLRGTDIDKSTKLYIERNFSDANVRNIANVIAFFLSKEKEDVVSEIYDLPDIKVDESIISTIESTEGKGKLDPAGFNPLNILNPTFLAFTAQKIWSEIKLERLRLAEKEIEYLELRHQELLLLRDGRNNPELESKIDKYQDEIQVTRVKIDRIRKSLG